MLDKLTSQEFLPLIGQEFYVQLSGIEPIALELVSVTEFGQSQPGDLRAPFSLIFLGPPSQQYLKQHIYCLQHEQLGALDLFIVPLGPQAGRMQYEVIFN